MGEVAALQSMISDKRSQLKKSMISDKRRRGGGRVKKIDWMIDKAMRELGVDETWRRGVARGANHLSEARFWEIVESSKKAENKPRYFMACISNELAKS